MKSLAEFTQYRTEALDELLLPIREEANRAKSQIWISLAVSLLVSSGALLLAYHYSGVPETAFLVGSVCFALGLVVCGVQYWNMSSARTNAFKFNVVRRIAEFIDPELEYFPSARMHSDLFLASGIFTSSPDRISGEDLIHGRYAGIELSFSELHAEYQTTTTDSKGHTTTQWHTIFKGVFMVADFNKDFQTRTVVVPDAAESAFGSYVGNILQKMNISRSGQLVKLEDTGFEKAFAVYGDDQVEARYILTPALMARIMELREKFGKDLALSFLGSKVFLAIPMQRDLFEVGDSLESPERLNGIFSDMASLAGVVDELNLTTRIWTKE